MGLGEGVRKRMCSREPWRGAARGKVCDRGAPRCAARAVHRSFAADRETLGALLRMFRGYVWVAARQFGSFEAYKARAPGPGDAPIASRHVRKSDGGEKGAPGVRARWAREEVTAMNAPDGVGLHGARSTAVNTGEVS